MPISEDEYEYQKPNGQSAISKAEQRRNNKPIMEKRRRARINHCLNELKTLILDAMKKDPARHSKLEKADILEMTVKHLQTLQRQQLAVAVATDPSVLHKFKTGFNECAGEVGRYIGNMDAVETGVKQRLAAHLSNCVSGLQQVSPFTFPGGVNGTSNGGNATVNIQQQNNNGTSTGNLMAGFNGDVNNNENTTRIQVPPGIQLIPSRLPTGELALLVPNSTNLPFFPSALLNGATFNTGSGDGIQVSSARSSSSAFTSVRPVKNTDTLKMTSPPLSPASSTTSFDDHQVSDSFQRPRTPSPKEVTVSFPTPPGPFHHGNTYSFHDQKPAQQFQITSTSYSPESKQDVSLKIEYKAVPIYQPSEKHREGNFKHSVNKSLEPLSVITADKPKIVAREQYEENINSFSRKRQYPGDAEGLLTLVRHDTEAASTSKFTRYSIDDVSISSSSSSSSSSTSSGSPEQRVYALDGHFHRHQSTAGSNNNGQPEDVNNEHMWRPW